MADIIIDDSVLRKKIARTMTNSIYGAYPNVPKSYNYNCYCKNDIETTKEVIDAMGTNYNDMYKHEVRVRVNGNCYYPTECFRYARTDGDEYRVHVKVMPELIAPDDSLHIKNVIFNAPATIVYWEDGSKTVVKCQEGDKFDPEKGITMAFFKRMHGNKGHYFEEIKKWAEPYYEQKNKLSLVKEDTIEFEITSLDINMIKGMTDPINKEFTVKFVQNTPEKSDD